MTAAETLTGKGQHHRQGLQPRPESRHEPFWSPGHLCGPDPNHRQDETNEQVRVRRVYDEPEADDGTRVLVDRIWPRGMTKKKASLHEWCKDVAPSTDLRKWYGHDPTKFAEFADRYRTELNHTDRRHALEHLHELAAAGERLTLLTGTKNAEISEAAVLATVLTTPRKT